MKKLLYISFIISLLFVLSTGTLHAQNKSNKKRLAKSYKSKHKKNSRYKKHKKRANKKVLAGIKATKKRNSGGPIKSNYSLSKTSHYLSVGLTLGALNYKGEFDQTNSVVSGNLKKTRPSLGITVTERFSPHISIRGGLMYGRLSGSDADTKVNNQDAAFRRLRNLEFTNDIFEFKIDVIYDIFHARSGSFLKRTIFTPYVFGGVAVFTNNPKANGKNLRKIGTSGQELSSSEKEELEKLYKGISDAKIPDPYIGIQVAIPFGFGIRQKVSTHFDVSFEIGFRFTFTDYIDDIGNETAYIGKDYASNILGNSDLADFNDGYIGSLSDIAEKYDVSVDPSSGFASTGNPKGALTSNFFNRRDYYIFTGFQVSYVLGKAVVSSKF